MRLEVLSDTALQQMEPARLMALIAGVQRFIDKAVAYQRRLIAVAESQRAARAVGDACVADSLVRNTGMSRGAARRAARQAKTIAAQPAVAGALACGDINTDQAEAIARADVGDEARRALVAAAVGEGTDATRERAAAAEIAARDETPEQRFMRQHANRFLRFYNNRDGMVCLEGALDPDNGARLKAKVTAIANRMWHKDKKQPPKQRRSPEQRDIDALCAATSQPRRPSPTSRASRAEGSQQPDFRTPDERQFDGQPDGPATTEPNSRGHNTNRSRSRTQGPHHRSAGDTERRQAAGAAAQIEAAETSACATAEAEHEHPDDGNSQCGDLDSGDSQCEDLDSGNSRCGDSDGGDLDDVAWVDYDNDGNRVVPVLRVSTSLDALLEGLQDAGITDSGESLSAATVRRLACDAEIIPTVLNGKGRVIDVGRRTRRVSEALRCVLVARDGGCVWPGCDAPPSRCDAHHVKHWADGGPTNADNLALLCHRHHILLHEGRHRLERAGDAWVVLKPDGTRLHTPLAAACEDIGSGHLGADDSIPSCQPGPDALCDLVTTANTDRTAATTLGHSREPSAGLATAANTDGTTAISDVDPGLRSTNGAAPTPPRQLTLACGDRNEFTMRLTATSREPPALPGATPLPPCGAARDRASLAGRLYRGHRHGHRLGLLDFELDVDPGGDFEALESVDGLLRRLQDVEQPLVDVHLEVLARVLVLEGGPHDRVAVLLRRQRNRSAEVRLGPLDRLDDLLGRLIQDLVVVSLEPDPNPVLGCHHEILQNYLMIFVTEPAPTVRPPSRMAKRRPSSMAMGLIRSTCMVVLSPGMHISMPSGRLIVPVTSVVRK